MILPSDIQVFGDTSFRGACPTETAEQVTFFATVRRQWPGTVGLIAVHIKNEGKRRAGQANWDKANGMTAGACDVFIPGMPSCLIELKRRDHTQSKISEDQLKYMRAAQAGGSFVCIALGYEAALAAVRQWVQ